MIEYSQKGAHLGTVENFSIYFQCAERGGVDVRRTEFQCKFSVRAGDANPGPNGRSVYRAPVFSTYYTKYQYVICISVARELVSGALNFHVLRTQFLAHKSHIIWMESVYSAS
jgi:hypothetical protein